MYKRQTWTHPRGGYFVSFDGPEGSAKRVGALCREMGVTLTPAGATWPYGEDPHDTNIRIDVYKRQDSMTAYMKISVTGEASGVMDAETTSMIT